MKYWWHQVVKDYLTFSAKERNGLVVMFLIAAAIFLFSRYFSFEKVAVSKIAFQQDLAQLKIVVDSSQNKRDFEQNKNYVYYSEASRKDYSNHFKDELFNFDPNTLDADGWKRLGIREKTISTIQKFLASGYKFTKAEDIKKIYGLSNKDAEKLISYIHIVEKKPSANPAISNSRNTASRPNSFPATSRVDIIDINTADTSALISLPGIGSKLAGRIVNFRQKIGGFSSVAQLSETYGLADSTFQKIKPYLQCINPALRTININTADINQLRGHPYLRYNIANAIINFRQQHGNYKSVDEIKKIDIITDELFAKIAPYLVV